MTVAYLGNVVGGHPVRYINVDDATLQAVTQRSLDDGQAVWFGCEVGKFLHREVWLCVRNPYRYMHTSTMLLLLLRRRES
jgi:bleomycin hydrolase